MQKTNAKILIALLLSALALPLIPMASASTGFIFINPATVPTLPALPAPSTPGQQIPAGGNVNLYTGGVTWSGGQIYLILSRDGFSQVSANDLSYSATFNLANITQNATSTYTNSIGTWTVGYNWINGSIPLDIAGGNYFIKAFDGTAAQIAVTDTYITVIAAFRVSPTSGAPGAPVTLRGYAFPANALVNLTYTAAPYLTGVFTIQNLTQANELGAFTVTIAAPDLKQAGAAGANPIANGTITFYAVNNATGATYTATYTEFFRGLLQVRTSFPGAGNVYGNNTDFTASFNVTVGSSLRLAGIYFYANGALTFMWDGSINITPTGGVVANGTGFFNTTVTIPSTPMGAHNLTITDANGQVFRIIVYVEPRLTLTPNRGPVGTRVTATGTGFPASSGTTVINATLLWPGQTVYIASAFTDSAGSFTTTFVVPQSAGGAFTIMSFSNTSLLVFDWRANAIFTVTPSFYVTPDTFSNSGSLIVLAWGTGFTPGFYYSVNLDNNHLAFDAIGLKTTPSVIQCNATGYLSFEFVGTGFRPGQHVVSLYANDTSTVAAWATFNVTTTDDSIAGMLTNINNTVVTTNTNVAAVKTDVSTIKTDVSSIKATVVSIDGNVATVKTDVGTVKTDVSSIKATVTSIDGKVATVQTSLGTVSTTVSSINAQITSISNGIATVQTSLGTVQTKLSNIDPVIGVIAGDTAAIQTTLGTITTSISAINPVLTSIEDGIATVKTDIGTLQGTVTSVKDGVATIQTNLGTLSVNVGALQTDVTATKDNTAGLSTLIYVAIVLALIAAIAAIASIFLMRQKIAS
ncbi:MAG: hypothetical protein N3D85_03680 [Candidatus Bathyarchaeota archaeon]|nr:hypothetical protein [Candidatus Bathyarchaeota archaeon]